MIISQTPYRVSFAGGGTDLPAFYREEYGAVLSTAISKHMYVALSRRFESSTRVAYSRTEIAESVPEIQHTIVREALTKLGLGPHLEIVTIGDLPAGTGMGSSSTLTVGLLNALYAYTGRVAPRDLLAAEACDIEIERLKKPIGKQDQYAAAFGGVSYIRFNPDETVEVHPVPVRPDVLAELERRILIVYTERKREADEILRRQSAGTAARMSILRSMRDLAAEMRDSLSLRGDLDEFARMLHEGWELKQSLGFGISDDAIQASYHAARRAGAQGGKLLGAGGGGFLLLIAPASTHSGILEALSRPRRVDFKVDRIGSRIAFISA